MTKHTKELGSYVEHGFILFGLGCGCTSFKRHSYCGNMYIRCLDMYPWPEYYTIVVTIVDNKEFAIMHKKREAYINAIENT